MAQPVDGQRTAQDGAVKYTVVCPQCHNPRHQDTPAQGIDSVRTLCDLCWQKRTEKAELYLLAGPERHHYVCSCGWQTWSRTTPMAVRIFGLSCFHCRKRWRQLHHCPACEGKGRS